MYDALAITLDWASEDLISGPVFSVSSCTYFTFYSPHLDSFLPVCSLWSPTFTPLYPQPVVGIFCLLFIWNLVLPENTGLSSRLEVSVLFVILESLGPDAICCHIHHSLTQALANYSFECFLWPSSNFLTCAPSVIGDVNTFFTDLLSGLNLNFIQCIWA